MAEREPVEVTVEIDGREVDQSATRRISAALPAC